MSEIRALVADDDPQLQDIMVRRLQKAGLQPDRANDGRMAIGLIEQTKYDLIVTDIYMPGATGLELLRLAKERDPHCQVIVVTAAATLDNAVEALNKGAFGYMTKPFDHISVFNNMIARALEFRKLILANQRMATSQRRRGDMLEEEVTERVKQLRQRHKELMDLLGALPDGVIVLGGDGRIALRSPVAEKWLTVELGSESQPIRDYLVKVHAAGGLGETQVQLGDHILNLNTVELPGADEKIRRVVIIREVGSRDLDFDPSLVEPLTKIHRSIDWLEKNQERNDLSSSLEFLRHQVSEIERLTHTQARLRDSKPEGGKQKDAGVGTDAAVQDEADAAWIDDESIAEESERGGNGRSGSGELGVENAGKISTVSSVEETATPQTDGQTATSKTSADPAVAQPIVTKQLSDEEMLTAFEGVPAIDPIEKEKAFEKLIAMLEGGANAVVSGPLDPQVVDLAGKKVDKDKTKRAAVDADDTPWPPLPPSKQS